MNKNIVLGLCKERPSCLSSILVPWEQVPDTPHHTTPHHNVYHTTQLRILYLLPSNTLYLLPHRTPSFLPFLKLHLLPSRLVSTGTTLSLTSYASSHLLFTRFTSLHPIGSSHIATLIVSTIPSHLYTPLYIQILTFFLFYIIIIFLSKVSSVELITPSVLSVTAEVSH